MPVTPGTPLRNATALVTSVSAVGQISVLWLLDLNAAVLGVAFAGCLYLMLALGLFGVSRFALFLAGVLPAARVLSGWNPLPILQWEQLRSIADLIIAVLALFLLWRARHEPTH
ncbi:MAG: hypothetical protein ABR578_00260 [Chromatocurvus sp.]